MSQPKELHYRVKYVCLRCRKVHKPAPPLGDGRPAAVPTARTCHICGDEALWVSRLFRTPKRTDDAGWKLVEFLVRSGFRFQRVYQLVDHRTWRRVDYPTNMKEAAPFVQELRSQSIIDESLPLYWK